MWQILIVSNDSKRLANTLDALNTAGHEACGVTTFEEATHLLACAAPDLVIADERLGAFNGLHVLLRARAEHPDVSAIVTTPATDHGLEADARHLNVTCMIEPQDPTEWPAAISRALGCAWLDAMSNVHHGLSHPLEH